MENIKEFTGELVGYLAALNLTLPDNAQSAIYSHFVTLEKRKHETNLISKNATFIEIVQNHYADSLAALGLIEEKAVVDVGSGAGFPGFPLAAFLPEKKFYLIEPRRLRVKFLEAAKEAAALNNMEIQQKRFETAALPAGEYALIQRAVFPPDELWKKIGSAAFKPPAIFTWSVPAALAANSQGAQKAGYRQEAELVLPWNKERIILRYTRSSFSK